MGLNSNSVLFKRWVMYVILERPATSTESKLSRATNGDRGGTDIIRSVDTISGLGNEKFEK
jgi:hypothetical protein